MTDQSSCTYSVPEAVALGIEWLRDGRIEEAASLYRQILERFPKQPDALHFLGLALYRQGRNGEAIELIEQALAIAPDYLDAHINLGNLLRQEGRLEAAATAFRRAIALAPERAAAHNNLGVTLKAMGDMVGALSEFEAAAALDPGFAEAHLNRGHLLTNQGRPETAIAAFEAVIRLRPDDAEAHVTLGRAWLSLQRSLEAEQAFRRAVALQPGHAEAHFHLGNALYRQERLVEAVEAYQAALRSDSSLTGAYGNLANTLLRLDRKEEAARIWQEWLQHDPGNPVARHMASAVTGRDVPPRADDEYVAQTFDQFAASFDERLQRLEYRVPELVGGAVTTACGAPRGELQVLDAGCGTGLCGPLLRPYAKNLVGVDLSGAMLEQARQRGVYDQLVRQELTAHLQETRAKYDLIVAADTLVYFGELGTVFAAAAAALRAGGRFVFTLESCGSEGETERGFELHYHGRYSHSERYVRTALREAALAAEGCTAVDLRIEAGEHVRGLLVTGGRGK